MQIQNTTGLPYDWKFYDNKGQEIELWVESFKLEASAQEVPMITAKLYLKAVELENVEIVYELKHPATGDMMIVAGIAFKDGSAWRPEDPEKSAEEKEESG